MFDVNEFLRGLEGPAQERAIEAGVRAVGQFGEHVLGVAQEDCPVETGTLQNSATSQPAKRIGDGIEKTIGFNTDYAAAVHERLDVHHSQGNAKYLENAMKTETPKLLPFVGEEMKKAL